MIPTMLVFGSFCEVFAIGGLTPRTLALIVGAGSIALGAIVGISSSSWGVAVGGPALGAVNAAVGVAFVWAISWSLRRRQPEPPHS